MSETSVLGIFFFRIFFMDSRKDFLKELVAGFEYCGCSCHDIFSSRKKIGFGVSGGADSMALLYSALLLRKSLFGEAGAEFVVVSINHNIRSQEESLADSLFVRDFCKGFTGVEFVLEELPRGRVEKEAAVRGRGVEEAARFLRYEIFQSLIKEKKCDYFCLAHNQNDQLETLLLRFLQGSGDGEAQGIPAVRDLFLRPMLQIQRKDIEDFLSVEGVGFRRDATNEENDYLRNRCRNLLVPLLNKEFKGWGGAVLVGAKKRQADSDFITSVLPKDFWKEDSEGNLYSPWKAFFDLHPALRRRVLFQGLNQLGMDRRVPFYLLESLVSWETGCPCGRIFSIGDVEVLVQKEVLWIKKLVESACEVGFSLLIEKPGSYILSGRQISIHSGTCPQGQSLVFEGQHFFSPFVIRSPLPGDKTLVGEKIVGVQEVLQGDFRSCGQQLVVVEEIGNPLVSIIVLS